MRTPTYRLFVLAVGLGNLLCLSLPTIPAPCYAESTLKFDVSVASETGLSAEVLCEELVILSFRGANAEARALELAQKLQSLAQAGHASEDFSVRTRGEMVDIMCASEVIASVDSEIGFAVLQNIQRAFALPYFSMDRNLAWLLVGEQLTLPVKGNARHEVEIMTTEGSVVRATLSPAGFLRISGLAAGSTEISLRGAHKQLWLRVVVLPREPGGKFWAKLMEQIESEQASEGVIAQGPPRAERAVLALWMSNHPENVPNAMPLFHAQVPSGPPARVFYHHKNISLGTQRFGVWIGNPDSALTQRLYVLQGKSLPGFSAPHAGQVAIRDFYLHQKEGRGAWYTLRPGQFQALSLDNWPSSATISGIIELMNFGEGFIDFYIESAPLLPQNRPMPASLGSELSKEWVFPGQRKLELNHILGQGATSCQVGWPAQPGLASEKVLRGDYGVEYKLQWTFANRSSFPREVELCFIPSGGYAHFVGSIDGRVIATPLVEAKQEVVLQTFSLGPNQERLVSLSTIPVGGCYYPVIVTAKDRG